MTTKTAWITGATSGFGAATVERLVAGDWRVVASGRRAERLQKLVDQHGADRVHAVPFDMRDDAAMEKAYADLPSAFSGIDLLVNNAGLALGTAPAQQADLAQWKQMIDTNVTALATMTHLLLPRLIERRGAIINISSISASYPYRGGNVYGATKAFVTPVLAQPAHRPARHRRAGDLDRTGHGRNRIHPGAYRWRPGRLGPALCGRPSDHRRGYRRDDLVGRQPAAAPQRQPSRSDAGQPVGGGVASTPRLIHAP